MTRVITFQMGHEMSGRAYPELGFGDAHHPCTHHQGDREKQEKTTQINGLHTKMLAYYLGKLRDTKDGDGSLLDHSMILYGAGLSDANLHLYTDLPLLLVAGGVGGIKGGMHVRYPNRTPMTNLLLTMLDKADVPHVDKLGDSTGRLDLPSGHNEAWRESECPFGGSPRKRGPPGTIRTEHGPSGRIAMNTRATILAALMGSTILAGAALARRRERHVAGDCREARGPCSRADLVEGPHASRMSPGPKARPRWSGRPPATIWRWPIFSCAPARMRRRPTNSAQRRFTRPRSTPIRRWPRSCWRPGPMPIRR